MNGVDVARLAILLAGAAALALAGEPAAAVPALAAEVSCPDAAATRKHIDAGPLATGWRLPGLRPAREQLDQVMIDLRLQHGLDGWGLIGDLAAIELRMAQPGGAAAFQFDLGLRLPIQGEAAWTQLGKRGAPAPGGNTVSIGQTFWRRDHEWLVLGDHPPAAIRQRPPPSDDADVSLTVAVLSGGGDPLARAVLASLGLGRLQAGMWMTATGSRERLTLPDFQPPFAAIDPAVLAGLPAQTLVVAACGIDGPRLDAIVAACADRDPGFAADLDGQQRWLREHGLPDMHATLKAVAGTAFLALTAGTPAPQLTLALPASPALDAIADAWGRDNRCDLAPARSKAVILPLTGVSPVLIQCRRSASHWLVSTDPELLDRLAGGGAGTIATGPLAAALKSATGAAAWFAQNTTAVVGTVLGFAPLALAQAPEESRALLTQLVQAGNELAPLLGRASAALLRDSTGSRITGDNLGIAFAVPALVVGIALPAIEQLRLAEARAKSVGNLKQLIGACLAYTADHQAMPKDLATLVAAQRLPAEVLISPGGTAVAAPHYLYVRPIAEPSAVQPVIVENPACNGGAGSAVAFADGQVKFAKGGALWDLALRLSASPKAAKDGIALADWKAAMAAAKSP